MPQRYGDFATWAGSIGTIAAFGTAFWQIHRERAARHRRELHDWLLAKREHADRVTAWVADKELVVSNQSHHLILDVGVELDDGVTLRLAHVEPGLTRVAAPGEHATRAVPCLRFTDARGDRWRRDAGGRPHLVDEPAGGHTHATAFAAGAAQAGAPIPSVE
ncbi:hypothetical protein [Microterricola viridarii]|uniref:Uncharacterized protein n=1 Tax=Microterricola viridarii TaxID=412690 RepID=A0A1H1NQH4_9MICO|nr:hypothetical protein [Microterricola viridarii]SDS01163.1 hypothetical protein SAMN04489834_0695 [Microterricola viridarii]